MTEKEKKDKLFQLFSQKDHDAAIIAKQQDIFTIMDVKNAQELSDDFLYTNFYQKIIAYKKRVEEIQAKPNGQVGDALDFLKDSNKGNSDNYIYALKLIEDHLVPGWDEKSKEKFQTGKSLIVEWVYFFLSYTNKSAPAINNIFKDMLLIELPATEFDKEKEEKNLMAKLIYNSFSVQKVYPFYDKVNIELGDKWKKEIFGFTKKSYALCQFIEIEMFADKVEMNYCFQEYFSYKKSMLEFFKRHGIDEVEPLTIYILKNPENSKDFKFEPVGDVEDEISEWIKDIKKTQFISSVYKMMPNQEFRDTIQLAGSKIGKWRQTILDKYLKNLKAPLVD